MVSFFQPQDNAGKALSATSVVAAMSGGIGMPGGAGRKGVLLYIDCQWT